MRREGFSWLVIAHSIGVLSIVDCRYLEPLYVHCMDGRSMLELTRPHSILYCPTAHALGITTCTLLTLISPSAPKFSSNSKVPGVPFMNHFPARSNRCGFSSQFVLVFWCLHEHASSASKKSRWPPRSFFFHVEVCSANQACSFSRARPR